MLYHGRQTTIFLRLEIPKQPLRRNIVITHIGLENDHIDVSNPAIEIALVS